MKNKFIKLYSSKKRSFQESDIINIMDEIKPNVYYNKRQNNFIYNLTDDIFHRLRFFDKNSSIDLFYLNRYKELPISNVQHLPFDTEHYVTQEVIGTSIFASKKNGRRCIFSRCNERDIFLENKIRNDINYQYIIDKFGNGNVLEFKYYNKEVYLVNMYNENRCFPFSKLEYISEYFDINIPKKLNSLVFKQGKNLLDIFYNDFYLDETSFVYNKNYYITFFFQNNNMLLYKLIA